MAPLWGVPAIPRPLGVVVYEVEAVLCSRYITITTARNEQGFLRMDTGSGRDKRDYIGTSITELNCESF